LGVMQQSETAANHAAPQLKQNAFRSSFLTSSLSSVQQVSLGQSLVWVGHSVGKPRVVCENHSVRELRGPAA
jgi:hypothetical protein